MGKGEIEKRDIQLEELKNQLDEVNLKIEQVNSNIQSRKLLFSGSVYIRQNVGTWASPVRKGGKQK
ncbi:hypothetical protein HZB07_06310 [Candidatus Saganbacteria bacterium]|nr:hypothetical protein [Candidatus Saganbacteria bacterium]